MRNIRLKVSKGDPEVAYLYLPDHPKKTVCGIVRKQIRLLEILPDCKGPDIYLDFNAEDVLVGIEILR